MMKKLCQSLISKTQNTNSNTTKQIFKTMVQCKAIKRLQDYKQQRVLHCLTSCPQTMYEIRRSAMLHRILDRNLCLFFSSFLLVRTYEHTTTQFVHIRSLAGMLQSIFWTCAIYNKPYTTPQLKQAMTLEVRPL